MGRSTAAVKSLWVRALANLRDIGVRTEGNLVHIDDVETLRRYAHGA